jgi:hypothetical protein
MGPLPRHYTTDFSVYTVSVTRSGTISVRGVLYTVPSRLVGCRLKVHVYDDRLICYLGTTPGNDRTAALLPAPRAASCIDGARARPPEDVGGVHGYAGFLDIIADPDNPERRDTKRWAGAISTPS